MPDLKLKGKRALVLGVANERSIAWAIAKALHAEGVELAFSYYGEALKKRVEPLASSVGSSFVESCDVSKEEEVKGLFEKLEKKWEGLDILVHALAFARREDLEGRYTDTSREGFLRAMDVSVYSLVELTHRAESFMKRAGGGSIITLSYLGAQRVVPNYNVMGVAKAALEASVRYLAADLGPSKIRVNAVSAGPIKTLAACGIRDFRQILDSVDNKAPLRENISGEDVGAMAAFLCSPLASRITGSTVYVDSGMNIMG